MNSGLTSKDYDEQWARLHDFIRFNPAARSRRRMIRSEISQLPSPASVLDAGCGLGYTVADLQKVVKTATITGVDFSPSAIEWAAVKFPSAQWICADITKFTPDRTFDLVVCTEVIEHIDDYDSVLGNLIRVTREGGYLILTTQAGKVHPTEHSVGHVRHFSRHELNTKLTDSGMEILRSIQWGWPGMTLLKYLANLKPEATIARYGAGSYNLIDKLVNHCAYALARVFSVPSSRFGCQIVITARRQADR